MMHLSATLAEIFGLPPHDILALLGMLIMAFAGWLQWRISWHASDIEDDEKEGKITAMQARYRLKFLGTTGPVLMAFGAATLLLAAIDWFYGLPM